MQVNGFTLFLYLSLLTVKSKSGPRSEHRSERGSGSLPAPELLESKMKNALPGCCSCLSALPAVHCFDSLGGRQAILLHLILARLHNLRVVSFEPKDLQPQS